MAEAAHDQKTSQQLVLLGDEAVALGAVHAGLTAAYAYPGTPSTEIVDYLLQYKKRHGAPHAAWAANEKTAFEAALGVSIVGRRSLVCMKHVGLNVAADPFMNAAVVAINGGLVVAVADDPGMHSSQNEQDTRYFADFAHTLCLEPATQQEVYAMTREAFDLSERFGLPVVLRLVTRLAHSRAVVEVGTQRPENPLHKPSDPASWILLPQNARRQWNQRMLQRPEIMDWVESTPLNALDLDGRSRRWGVITTGIARNYVLENWSEIDDKPAHLHISAYPIPVQKVRALARQVERLVVIEEGYPYVERYLRGLLPAPLPIAGKLSGELPLSGELNSDVVRRALGLSEHSAGASTPLHLPTRPPQLCQGCSHIDAFTAIARARASFDDSIVTADIGCYTLGALPPYNAIESCVCMGASVGMAKGAAEAGLRPALGVIGDSTFCHSGVTPLMDAVADKTPMTLVIDDNETTAMTGGQPTIVPSSRLEQLVLGTGIAPEHCHVVEAHRKNLDRMVEVLKQEMAHDGPSVIIFRRECLETAKKH
ncbi:MAG: thiamine pyrophosphate-dependent enzyme [Pseudomonadota bacterium]